MRRAALGALLSHWRRAPLHLLALVAGLMMATALWSGVQAINAEARASYDAAARTLQDGQLANLLRPDGAPFDEAAFATLRRAGVLVSPVVEGRLAGQRLIGIEPLTAPFGIGPVGQADAGDLSGFLGRPGQIHACPEVLEALRATGLAAVTGAEAIPAPQIAPGTALMDLGLAQRLLGLEGQVTRLLVAPGARLEGVAELVPDLILRAPAEGAEIGRLTDSFHLNLTAFGLLAFAVGLFIVHGAVGLAFEQRRSLVRTLRALGLPLGLLLRLLVAELVLIALVAGGLGLVLGHLLAGLLMPDVAASLSGLYGESVAPALTFRPIWALSGLAMTLAGTALAAGGALGRLVRTPLLATGSGRAGVLSGRAVARLQGAGGAALLALALALWLAPEGGLALAFLQLGCLLLGAALILPRVLDLCLAFGQARAKGALAQWIWADSRSQLPGLSLALAALLLAMAANVGVSTMVASFRTTFEGFLDQRLAPELYAGARDPDEAARWMALAEPLTEAVLPLLVQEATLAGLPGQVYGVRDHATYRENWRFLDAAEAPWDRVAAGEAALINEQLSRRAGLSVGDRITLGGAEFPIVGIYGDYGNPVGQAVLSETRFAAIWPEVRAARFGLRLDPARTAEVRDALIAGGVPPEALIDQGAIKALSREVFERTFAVTAALNVLTLTVAALAMFLNLLTLSAMRLVQLAPVWAVGLPRAALGWIEMGRSLVLAALTAALALPLGLGLAHVLLTRANPAAFGWRLPMFLFPGSYVTLILLALLAAALAALWPALRLARMPPAALIKVFVHDR